MERVKLLKVFSIGKSLLEILGQREHLFRRVEEEIFVQREKSLEFLHDLVDVDALLDLLYYLNCNVENARGQVLQGVLANQVVVVDDHLGQINEDLLNLRELLHSEEVELDKEKLRGHK